MKSPKGKHPKGGGNSAYQRKRSDKQGQKKPRDGWVKKRKVWKTDNLRRDDRRSNRVESEEDMLNRVALSSLGPGGYARFGDIPAHKLGRGLRSKLYKVAGELGEAEKNNLASRIKHAATTVTASLASGFGECTFRAGVNRALESRGALYAIQDHLQHLADEGLLDEERFSELREETDAVLLAVNEYLGQLVKHSNTKRV